MGLESGTYLEDLVTTNPGGGTDAKSQGDDHLRLLKTVLKNTFPGFAGRFTRWQAKSGSYTPVLNDDWSLIEASGALTLNLTAAATLGNGWSVLIYARAGAVIVDPNGAEQVNGAATVTVPSGYFALLHCDGTKFALAVILQPSDATFIFQTGDVKLTLRAAADAGWVMMNDGSIGDATSGATTRANADTEPLFTLLWNNVSNTWAPVSSGRGASAAADFAVHKTLTLPKALGRALSGAGTGSGLSARALGEVLGEEIHALSVDELASHNHSGSSVSITADGGHAHQQSQFASSSTYEPAWITTGGAGSYRRFPDSVVDLDNAQKTAINTQSVANHSHGGSTVTVASQGSGTAHNTMQPSVFLNVMVKL